MTPEQARTMVDRAADEWDAQDARLSAIDRHFVAAFFDALYWAGFKITYDGVRWRPDR